MSAANRALNSLVVVPVRRDMRGLEARVQRSLLLLLSLLVLSWSATYGTPSFDEVRRALEQRKQEPFKGEGDSRQLSLLAPALVAQ